MRDEMLLYYERELDYLRKMAVQFAERHPKVASRLVLEPTRCEDPHVERLLEAFAFLSARVHLKIDDEFPEISEALLTVIYPQLVRPIPSMSIVEFQLDPEEGKLAGSLPIASNSIMHSPPVGGAPCTFRTCYEAVLWPISVTAAEWKPPSRLQPPVKASDSASALRVEISCNPGVTFQELKIDRLRFYLNGESGFIHSLYEILFTRLNRILVRDATPGSKLPAVSLPASALQPVGFADSEGMMSYPRRSFVGHHLLLEYFSFPEKFFFIDLNDLSRIWPSGPKQRVELIFLISDVENEDRRQRLETELSAKTFRLGCAPVVNLFPQVAEPIQLNQRKYEYPIVPDVRRAHAVEVFSVDEVVSISTETQETAVYEPFYSLRHSTRSGRHQCFWLARRRPSIRPNDEGTDMFLSLIDLSLQPVQPEGNILSIRTTCTNRDLPSRLPFGNEDGDFELDGSSPVKRIVALRKPTPTIRPHSGKASLWRLISHLSLNHLSLVQEGTEALKQILRLYDYGQTASTQNLIDSILQVKSSPHFARVSSEQGISFARGTRIELQLDENHFVGSGAFLFACVLERFLGLSASLNSFTQLVVTTPQRKGVLHEWMPRAGRKILL
jgi:type VI secretion system protein ImpG